MNGYIKSKKYDGVYHYKKNNGDISYYVMFKDSSGKSKRVKVGDRSKGITEIFAYNKRSEIINDIKLGSNNNPLIKKKDKLITFDYIAHYYFDDIELYSKSTKDRFGKYKKHILPYIGSSDISIVTSTDIEKILKEKVKGGYAPHTVNMIVELISTIYNYSINRGLYKGSNPCSKVKKLKIDNKRERYLTVDEVKLLLDTVKKNDLLYLFTLISLSTGARLNSVLHITKKDVDLASETITIKDFKSNSTYKGFIRDDLSKLLKPICSKLKQNDYIVGGNSVALTKRVIDRKLNKILDELFNSELDKNNRKERATIHTLRHTFASLLAINDVSIYKISKLLNHSSVSMTERYAKLAPNSSKDDVKGLF